MTTTSIEWVRNPDGSPGKVWNPVTGCSPVSAGCCNCYGKRFAARFWKGHPFGDVSCHPERLDEPLTWSKPQRVFTVSMGDLFHPEVPFEFQVEIFNVMAEARAAQHTFMLLTKRPRVMLAFYERLLKFTAEGMGDGALLGIALEVADGDPARAFPNVWVGVSVERQDIARTRIPVLLQVPAALHFVSVEPCLGPVDLTEWFRPSCTLCELPECTGASEREGPCADWKRQRAMGLQWVICGAETGPAARPMAPAWAVALREQCQAAGIPYFFKRMSGRRPIPPELQVREWPASGANAV